MPTVFISYSHKDEIWVKDYLVANLENSGIPCHVDYRDFDKGQLSSVNMERAVESCSKTILVFTENWFSSENTQFEAAMLMVLDPVGAKGRINPVLLDKVDIPLRFQIYTYYDFTDKSKSDSVLNELIGDLKQDIGSRKSEKKTYPVLDDSHIEITRLPQTGFELFGRHEEQTLLNEAWQSETTHVVSFVAYGGVGKSTLVNKWAEKMRWDNYRGAEKVYAWSFYSQGTSERVTSADMFINHALQWFGDENPDQGSAWDKGKRLAKLINNHKTLLILDGLEPLQGAEKVEKGKIKDSALATLVTELAKNNKGLCLITTREHVPELDRYTKTTQQLNLELISDEAGRKLLETRRIFGSEKELERMVQQFGNHALAINLLAEYLRIFENHRLEKANSIPDINIPDQKGKHARRIIEAFANHFGSTTAEFQLLSIMGLFDRPVPIDAINAIIGDNPNPGLSDKITDTSGSDWLTTLKNLRKYKLIFEESEHRPSTFDCHPLIREHFGEKLEQQNPNACKQAHARLYEYYKKLPEKELPDTLEEMEPLFAAVMHGCVAGKHQEALDEVYRRRMHRGPKAYNQFTLGAISGDLAAVSCFFDRKISDQPWQGPAAELSAKSKGYVLNEAGWDLRALGRLEEARQPIIKAFEVRFDAEDWIAAANSAANCSTILLQVGEFAEALNYAKKGVEVAERSNDRAGPWGPQHSYNRAFLGEALHKAGKTEEARKAFDEAEQIQAESDSDHPLLHAVMAGFLYCEFLLDQGEYQNVKKRVLRTLEWNKKKERLRDIAFDHLSLGRANLIEALQKEPTGDLSEATKQIDKAVNGLREARQEDHLCHGLLARAALRRVQRKLDEAWADVKEVLEIAEEGPMKLHQADAYLESARLYVKEDDRDKARDYLDRAKVMIEGMGYHRRDRELEALEKVLVKGEG